MRNIHEQKKSRIHVYVHETFFQIFFLKKVCLQHNWLTTIFIYNWLPQLIKIEICALLLLPPISGRQAEYSVLLKSEFLFPSFINNAFEVAVAATFLHSISVTMLAVTYHSACWTLFRNSGCMMNEINCLEKHIPISCTSCFFVFCATLLQCTGMKNRTNKFWFFIPK